MIGSLSGTEEVNDGGATPGESEGTTADYWKKTPPGPWNFKPLTLYVSHFHILWQSVFPTHQEVGKNCITIIIPVLQMRKQRLKYEEKRNQLRCRDYNL